MLITARGCWERGDLLAQHRPCYGSSSGPKLKSDPGRRHSTCGQLAAIWRRVFYRGGPWRVCSSGSQLLAGAQLLPRQLQQALESCKAPCEPLPDSPSPPPPQFPRGICRMPPKLFGLPQDRTQGRGRLFSSHPPALSGRCHRQGSCWEQHRALGEVSCKACSRLLSFRMPFLRLEGKKNNNKKNLPLSQIYLFPFDKQ